MIGIDVGGTFTDVVSFHNGTIVATKVPSNPAQMETSVLAGCEAIGVKDKKTFNHSSTAGLNAVITRKLPKIAFLTTEGHRDILDMGRNFRPFEALTDYNWRRPFSDAGAPLVRRYLRRGITERIKSDGSILIPLDEAQARQQLDVIKKSNVKGVAICLINAYVNPEHEIRLRELVNEVLGDIPCSISSEVSPLAKEYARASTTVIDVFMKLIFGDYLKNLFSGLRELGFTGQINLADCAAMLTPASNAMQNPFRIVYSGPAAGTVSTSYFGKLIGENNLLCCDIGGTSSDISIVREGKPCVNTTFEVEHDLLVNTLSNEVWAIGAGGGSIVSVTPTGEMKVGPESAGSDPGPACYGRGGSVPTVSDACLLIGILDPDRLLGGKVKLDPDLAKQAFDRLDTKIEPELRVKYAYDLAINNISEGLFDIIVRHGVDPREFSLMAYGAAGPMLLAAVMEKIGVKRVVVPPYPGTFSAMGLLSSDLVYTGNRSAYIPLNPDAADKINAIYEEMEKSLLEGIDNAGNAVISRTFDAHLHGQTWETPFVSVPSGKLTPEGISAMISNFHEEYEKRWGNRFEFMPVVSATFRTQAIIHVDKVEYKKLPIRESGSVEPERTITMRYLYGQDLDVFEYDRTKLCCGDVIQGPAIIREPMSTTQILTGQTATVGQYGEIFIERRA